MFHFTLGFFSQHGKQPSNCTSWACKQVKHKQCRWAAGHLWFVHLVHGMKHSSGSSVMWWTGPGSAPGCSSVMDPPETEAPATGFGKVVRVVGFFSASLDTRVLSLNWWIPAVLHFLGSSLELGLPQKNKGRHFWNRVFSQEMKSVLLEICCHGSSAIGLGTHPSTPFQPTTYVFFQINSAFKLVKNAFLEETSIVPYLCC